MGVRAESVHGVISRALATLVKAPGEELLAMELARCDALLSEAMSVVTAFHPLVQGGEVVRALVEDTDGNVVQDPISGTVVTVAVEDKAPKLAAINTALRVMERRAKLLGLDRPTKVAATDPSGSGTASLVQFCLPSNGRDLTAV
jgi:hypothetical protein